jgi:tetratricopeptide (TPR) repeat protein
MRDARFSLQLSLLAPDPIERRSRLRTAVAYFTCAIEDGYGAARTEGYAGRCTAYNYLQDYTAALADCDQAIALAPRSSGYHVNRAVAYAGLERYDQAEADLRTAIDLQPRNSLAFYNLAVVYTRQQQYERALETLDTALALDPNQPSYYVLLSDIAQLQGRFEDEITALTRIIALDNDIVGAFRRRCIALVNVNRLHEALRDCSYFINQDASNPDTWVTRALGLYHPRRIRRSARRLPARARA